MKRVVSRTYSNHEQHFQRKKNTGETMKSWVH